MEPWTIGPFAVWPFGAVMAPAAAAALAWTAFNMKKAGLKAGTASWFALFSVPLAVIFARLGYCLFIIDQILGNEDPGLILRVWEGGFLLWGALGGGLLAAWLTGRVTGQKAAAVMDAAAVPACLLIVVGRIACGLLFADHTGFDLPSWFDPETPWFDPELGELSVDRYSLFALEDWSFFERFPFAVMNYYEEWCWAVFVPEALWAAVTGVIVLRAKVREGGRITLFLLLYACGQITLESMLRGEVLHLPWLNFVRANQVLCAAAILVLLALCARRMPKGGRLKPALIALAQVVAAMGIVVVTEFAAFEKKISLIAMVPADICHLATALACLWMALAVLPLWRRAFKTI